MTREPLLPTVALQSHTHNGYGTVLSSPSKPKHGYRLHDVTGRCSTYVAVEPTSNRARNKLILAATICLFFTFAEAVGGYLSNSLAIFTDASHMTIDFISYTISIVALWIAKRPETRRMTYGWHRAEVLGAVMSVFTIWVVTGVLIYMAIFRIIDPNYELEPNPMLITAVLGVVVNIVMGLVLMPEDICGSKTDFSAKKRVNINLRAAFIHVLGDIIQSLGVLIGAIIIKFKPTWKLADPICTFFFAILVLITTINILNDALSVLMEGMPGDMDKEDIERDLLHIGGVKDVHCLNIWSLTMDRNVITVHLTVTVDEHQSSTYSDILKAAKIVISNHSSSFHQITVQLEPVSLFDDQDTPPPSPNFSV